MSTGAKVGLVTGVAGVVLLLLVVILVVALSRPGAQGRTPGGSYVVNLNQGAKDVRQLHFQAGRWVSIRVISDRQTDVDLYVYDQFGRQIVADDGPEKDCFVRFRVPATGMYRVEIVNLGPGFNRAVVRYN
jgi:hypothetical protein